MLSLSGEEHRTFCANGAWCFFADPRAVSYQGKFNRTYVGWITNQGDVKIGFIDHTSDRIEEKRIKVGLQADDHANPALYIDPQGYISIYYSAHNGGRMFYRTSKQPEDIRKWEEERQLEVNTEGTHGYTYPNPIYLQDEKRLFLFWRGGDFKPNFSTSQNNKDWQPARTLIKGSGARPYVKYVSNGKDKIYFGFTDGHPLHESENNVYCAYYYKGSIYRTDDTKIRNTDELPITPAGADKVYDASTTGANAWVWDIAIDSQGNPIIVYAIFISATDHRYRYSSWNGTTWEDHEITAAGSWFPETPEGEQETEPYYSGGLILDADDPRRVYLSREIDGVFEIEKWETRDQGKSWMKEQITSRSKQNNVRPYLSRGTHYDKKMFWMNGKYIYYTKYHTIIKMQSTLNK